MYNHEHLLGMFAMGMTFLSSTEAEYDQLIGMVIAREELPENVSAMLAKAGQNFKGDTSVQKLLTARKLQRMLKELQAITT